jgi:hypothetical protein
VVVASSPSSILSTISWLCCVVSVALLSFGQAFNNQPWVTRLVSISFQRECMLCVCCSVTARVTRSNSHPSLVIAPANSIQCATSLYSYHGCRALTQMKQRLIGAKKGHGLLKKKSDALTIRFRAILQKIKDLCCCSSMCIL